VLQRVQCVAVCCSVLQCVAACGVLECGGESSHIFRGWKRCLDVHWGIASENRGAGLRILASDTHAHTHTHTHIHTHTHTYTHVYTHTDAHTHTETHTHQHTHAHAHAQRLFESWSVRFSLFEWTGLLFHTQSFNICSFTKRNTHTHTHIYTHTHTHIGYVSIGTKWLIQPTCSHTHTPFLSLHFSLALSSAIIFFPSLSLSLSLSHTHSLSPTGYIDRH